MIAIKLEVDTRPPAFGGSESTLLTRHVALHLRHHDRATLLAGKLMAALSREYIKGRDWFDLWWYLEQGDWPSPNFAYLNNGLQQYGSHYELTERNWKLLLLQRVEALDWKVALRDVEPFIIGIDQLKNFGQERLVELLS